MMKADNDNKLPFRSLDDLPLFATDKEIAVAVVGRQRADYWIKVILPSLERSGFPAKDPLHDARAVPLVKKFYDAYFGITSGIAMAKPDGEERFGEWRKRKPKAA